MRRISSAVLFTFLLILMCMPAVADPVISVSGAADGFPAIDGFQPLAVGWNQTNPALVDISISFMDLTFSGPMTYSAFLMDQIGVGTSAANEIASTTFLAETPVDLALSSFILFTNRMLNPGNYFLVVGVDPALDLGQIGTWGAASEPTIFTGPGVTDLGQYFAFNLDPFYLPASDFLLDQSGTEPDTSTISRLLYEVQSVSDMPPIPEPSTLMLVLGPALGLIILKRRRG